MKNIEKRLDELYQHIEEINLKWMADNYKKIELQERVDKIIKILEELLNILKGEDK